MTSYLDPQEDLPKKAPQTYDAPRDGRIYIFKSCRNCLKGMRCIESGCYDRSGETYCQEWELMERVLRCLVYPK
jgi:hypothetical protein